MSAVLLLVAIGETAWANDEYDVEDYPAIQPVIEAKNLKLPELWEKNLMPQYRLAVAREVVVAARKMAFNQLVSGVADIKLGDDMTVGSLLARSDKPDVKPEFFVRGVRENGIIYRQDSLIVEITMEVSRKSILGSIKCWLEVHLSSENQKYVIKLRDYIESLKGGELRAFGVAAADARYVRPEYAAVQQKAASLVANVPTWVADVVHVRGQGEIKRMTANQQQARDDAFDEATNNARKAMIARVLELKESGDANVGKFIESVPELTAGLAEIIKSAKITKGTEVIIGDDAEVTVSLDLKKVWNMLLHYRLTGK